VESPRDFSFADLKALPKQEQITTHFCIQGWSGVTKQDSFESHGSPWASTKCGWRGSSSKPFVY
jgi:DMSO/TMAO reductase YedYZ molybdopterin-dependent catalytic subunit